MNPLGVNDWYDVIANEQTVNTWSDAAREAAAASRRANAASSSAGPTQKTATTPEEYAQQQQPRPRNEGLRDLHRTAAQSHVEAAQAHKSASASAKREGNKQAAKFHASESKKHGTLAGEHSQESVRQDMGIQPRRTVNAGESAYPSEDLDITPEKACQIVKDGEVHGHSLSESQQGMFGALCGERGKSTANTRWSLWQKLGSLLGINAGNGQPRHGDTGQYLPHGAGTGKGPAHAGALAGHGTNKSDGDKYNDPTAPAKLVGTPNPKGYDGRNVDEVAGPKGSKGISGSESDEDGDMDTDDHQTSATSKTKGGTNDDPLPTRVMPFRQQPAAYNAGFPPKGPPQQQQPPIPPQMQRQPGPPQPPLQKPPPVSAPVMPPQQMPPQRPPMQQQPPAPAGKGPPANYPQAAVQADERQASKAAAQASMESESPTAQKPAMEAMQHAQAGKTKQASSAHVKAAEMHEDEATEARKSGDQVAAGRSDKAAFLHRKAASLHAATGNKRGIPMNATDRKEVIGFLVTNCECGKVPHARQLLGRLSDEALSELVLSAGKRKRGFTANEKAEGSNADATGSGTIQAGDEEGSDDHDYKSEEGKGLGEVKPKASSVVGANMSMEEWMQVVAEHTGFPVPAVVQNSLKIARDLESREKTRVIQHIVSNIHDSHTRKGYVKELLQKDLTELQRMAALIPQRFQRAIETPSYLGASAAMEVNAQPPDDRDDILPLPTVNWSEESDVGKLRDKKRAN